MSLNFVVLAQAESIRQPFLVTIRRLLCFWLQMFDPWWSQYFITYSLKRSCDFISHWGWSLYCCETKIWIHFLSHHVTIISQWCLILYCLNASFVIAHFLWWVFTYYKQGNSFLSICWYKWVCLSLLSRFLDSQWIVPDVNNK